MRVRVTFTVETPEFGKEEFQREIERLIYEIDPINTELIDFDMYEVRTES